MSNFFKTIHNKLFHKKEQPTPSQNIIQIPEQIVAKMDYKELVNAIVEANHIIEKEKEEKEEKKRVEQKIHWQKALMGEKYDEKEKPSNWKVFWGVVSFKKKNATDLNAIHILLKMCNNLTFFFYQVLFCILEFFLVTNYIKQIINHLSPLNFISVIVIIFNVLGILITIPLLIFIVQTIRIAKIEAENCNDKNMNTTIFNLVTSFTSMAFSIIAVVVTIITIN